MICSLRATRLGVARTKTVGDPNHSVTSFGRPSGRPFGRGHGHVSAVALRKSWGESGADLPVLVPPSRPFPDSSKPVTVHNLALPRTQQRVVPRIATAMARTVPT